MAISDTERFTISIQESISTAIAFADDSHAAFIASAVDVTLLDPPLSDIVARCINYRKRYRNKPPGREHIDDVFSEILSDHQDKRYNSYQRVLTSMLRLERQLNTRYVADQVLEFNRRRNQRVAIQRAAELYQNSPEDATEQIDTIFRKSLRDSQTLAPNQGFTLAESAALSFLDRDASDYCLLGIEPLDRIGCIPTRGELLLFIAARNRGKSFFTVHAAKMAALRWPVAYYSLEMNARSVAQRFYQSMYSGVKREGDYHYTKFEERGGETIPRTAILEPDWVVDDKEHAAKFLARKIDQDKRILGNIRIKSMPTGSFSFSDLERDLDSMELLQGWVPALLIIDYPALMRLPGGNNSKWEKLADLAVSLRGLAVSRNMAVLVPQQGGRSAEQTDNVQGYMGAGTIEFLSIADNAITYSQTEAEAKAGIARLHTAKVRNDRARDTILISQSYATGQFCMDARLLSSDLRSKVESYLGKGYNDITDDANEDDETETPHRGYNLRAGN